MTKFIAVYERVSSKSQNTESQRPDLNRWVDSQNEPVKWFSDSFTGKTMNRKDWNKLQAAIDRGEVSKVAVWRLDRLGRTAAGLTKLFDELREKRVNLVSLREGFDLSTPAGRLMANVLASAAQYETEIRVERVLAGQAVAKANGKKWGGSKKGRRLWVTDEQVAMIQQLNEQGKTKSAIARATGLSRQTVYNLIAQFK